MEGLREGDLMQGVWLQLERGGDSTVQAYLSGEGLMHDKFFGAQLRKHIDATLGSGNLREAVKLPPGEDLNEWLAVNTVDFFNQVNLLYGTLTEFCTPENCRTMTAGPKYAIVN
ncbi:MOB kinase activator 1-like [Trifolium pratense]|uniref:MOB kinase activator 1-like n=2 Tax=Trifolium TaxID=3898 RepID=A0A2K3NPN9_TRIPR|nr:MOB kinase activator 1-like [Trifolium pratense]